MGDPRLSNDPLPTIGLSGYTGAEPLLLWTDYGPNEGGGGAVLLRSLLRGEDRSRVLWATPSAMAGEAPDHVVYLRAGSAGRGIRRSLFLDSTLFSRALADETARVAEARRARAVWVVLHGAGVPVAAELVNRSALPLHVTVHDDPAFAVALRSRRYLAITPWIEHELARALRGARSVDVISEGMRERYSQRYGVDSIVVHRAVSGPVTPAATYDAPRHGLRVGVLGNTYSYAQLPVLGRALARAAHELRVEPHIVMVGRGYAERLRKDLGFTGVKIEDMGHIDESEAVRSLSQCFAVYLNYPFGRRDAVLRETSFPTKLATYVLAARPIVAHAPRRTTLAPLSAVAGYVHPWTTMLESDGAALFVRMWNDPTLRASCHEAAEAVRARYYDAAHNRRALAGALNALAPRNDAPTGTVEATAR